MTPEKHYTPKTTTTVSVKGNRIGTNADDYQTYSTQTKVPPIIPIIEDTVTITYESSPYVPKPFIPKNPGHRRPYKFHK